MYTGIDVNLFLTREKRIFCGIADSEQTCHFITFGSIYERLYLVGLIGYRNMKYSAETFGGGGKQHVFYRAPCRGEIVE